MRWIFKESIILFLEGLKVVELTDPGKEPGKTTEPLKATSERG
jgi:hypothetical protein